MVRVIKTNSTKINIPMTNNLSKRITIIKKKASRMTRTTKISTQTQTTTIRMDMVMIRLTIRIHFTNNPLTIHTKTQMEALVITIKITLTTIAMALLLKTLLNTVEEMDTTIEMEDMGTNTEEIRLLPMEQKTILTEEVASMAAKRTSEEAKD